jgi:hypothetical protein
LYYSFEVNLVILSFKIDLAILDSLATHMNFKSTCQFLPKTASGPDMVACACNASTQEAEEGGL